jgi:ribosomal-protein-alanine N-acetyltransferase
MMMSASQSTPQGPIKIQNASLAIRRLRPQDIPDVMEIESISFGRHHWSEESFHNEMNNQVGRYYALINTEIGKLIGYQGFWLIADESHITTVAVKPEYRGNALGELMVSHCLERCARQSIHWVTLEVRISNYSAQNLYYKYGFTSVGLRPKYYQDNQEDALIMTTPDISSAEYRQLCRKLKENLVQRLGGLPEGFGV